MDNGDAADPADAADDRLVDLDGGRRAGPNARAIALMDVAWLLAPHERRALDEQLAWETWVDEHDGQYDDLRDLWYRRRDAFAALEERGYLTDELADLLALTQTRLEALVDARYVE